MIFDFSSLTMLAGRQESIRLVKMSDEGLVWLSAGARCRLFACGLADATAIPKLQHLLPHLNPDWFYLSSTSLPRWSWKRGQ